MQVINIASLKTVASITTYRIRRLSFAYDDFAGYSIAVVIPYSNDYMRVESDLLLPCGYSGLREMIRETNFWCLWVRQQ